MSSGDSGEATPVPMPNTEVKLSSADGSWETCKSRTLLGDIIKIMDAMSRIETVKVSFFCPFLLTTKKQAPDYKIYLLQATIKKV